MNTQERFFDPQFAEAEHAPGFEHKLQAGIEYSIDPSTPLAHDRYGDIVATIATSSKYSVEEGKADSFVLIDVRNNPRYTRGSHTRTEFGDLALNGDIQYVLVGDNFTEPGKPGMKGLRSGESFTLGREHKAATARFNLKDQTSRHHFRVQCTRDGKVVIQDLESSNGTRVTSGRPLSRNIGGQYAHAGEHEQPREHHARQEQAKQRHQEHPQSSDRPQPEPKLNQAMERRLKELNKQFSAEIEEGLVNDAMIISVLHEVNALRMIGMQDAKILRQIARRIHPDRFPEGTPEHERMSALFKIVNQVVGK